MLNSADVTGCLRWGSPTRPAQPRTWPPNSEISGSGLRRWRSDLGTPTHASHPSPRTAHRGERTAQGRPRPTLPVPAAPYVYRVPQELTPSQIENSQIPRRHYLHVSSPPHCLHLHSASVQKNCNFFGPLRRKKSHISVKRLTVYRESSSSRSHAQPAKGVNP